MRKLRLTLHFGLGYPWKLVRLAGQLARWQWLVRLATHQLWITADIRAEVRPRPDDGGPPCA